MRAGLAGVIHSLPLFHRINGQTVIVLGAGEAAEAKQRLVERAGGIVSADENAAAGLAFVALDEPDAAASRLKARGILVNAVDRPDLCDFTTPSILDRSPVLIAIGTGGASAGLAKALRLRLELLLPASLGALASALGAARSRLRSRFPDAGQRRRALDAALTGGGPLDPLNEDSVRVIDQWLEAAGGDECGTVEIILRSDDPDDLTLREARLLGSADLILHEPAIPAAILNRARADAVRVVGSPDAARLPANGLVVFIRL
jgi:uroporphyrin-III C-methyltransferase/precorrin-2 dehydrogenase/sirohydrochlorin ferrochelatase